MAEWCEYYDAYVDSFDLDIKKEKQRKENFQKDLRVLIGDDLKYLSKNYHYEKSREALYGLKELHTEGKAYKEIIQKMFYLNDDFNDTMYHFYAAAERYLINTGNIGKNLDIVKKKLENSNVYDLKRFLEEMEPKPI
jgi:hypothetical protein